MRPNCKILVAIQAQGQREMDTVAIILNISQKKILLFSTQNVA